MEQEGILYVEIVNESGYRLASPGGDLEQLKQESEKAINLALGAINTMAHRVTQSLRSLERELTPDEVEIEFGVKLEVEAGTIVPWISKTTGGGQLSVKFKWTIDRPETNEVLISPTK